jgi:hypothetical protein
VVVDGTQINSPGTNSRPNISVPAPDAIQEFIVQTSPYNATRAAMPVAMSPWSPSPAKTPSMAAPGNSSATAN